jgi:hypothetical protein
MAGKVLNFKVCSPLKLRSDLAALPLFSGAACRKQQQKATAATGLENYQLQSDS